MEYKPKKEEVPKNDDCHFYVSKRTNKSGVGVQNMYKKWKGKELRELLEAEYALEQSWSMDHTKEIACKLGLSYTQVYKWKWDRDRADT